MSSNSRDDISRIRMQVVRTSKSKRRLPSLRRFRGPIGSLILTAILIAVWHASVANGLVNELILPRPLAVGGAIIDLLSEGFFYSHLWTTTYESLVGFVLGTVIGFLLGVLLGTSRSAREISYPFVIAFQGLPKVVLAPVFVTAFGFGVLSKIVMAVAISFFPVLINTMTGLRSVDPEAVRLMRSLTATRRHILTKLALPHSLPLIFAGIKTGLTLALIGALVGEFVGAERGLGFLLESFTFQLDIPAVWAVTTMLAVLGVALFLLIEWLGSKIVFWQ